MSRRAWLVLAGIVVVVLGLGGPLLAMATDPSKPQQQTPALDLASAASSKFLSEYVGADGKVRLDADGQETQGQAQAWGLLIAAGSGDSTRFAAMLNWTNLNLPLPSRSGEVDMDIAWALAAGAPRLGDTAYSDQAKSLAKEAFSAHVMSQDALTVLPSSRPDAAFNYQVQTGQFFFRAAQELQPLTPSLSWPSLLAGERSVILSALGGPNYKLLPYETVTIGPKLPLGSVTPASAQYTGSATAVPLNLATSCNANDKAEATFIWTKLRVSRDTRYATALSTSGKTITKTKSVRSAVGSAAASQAAGEGLQTLDLLVDADGIQQQHPTTEGAAWDALGRILITTPWLGACK